MRKCQQKKGEFESGPSQEMEVTRRPRGQTTRSRRGLVCEGSGGVILWRGLEWRERGTSGRGGNRYKEHLLLRLDDNDWSGSRKKGQWYPSGKRQKQEDSI